MSEIEYPWEPPVAASEAEHIIGALDRMRWTFRWKADGLDAVGLNTRIGASWLTIGGLLKHLASVEDYKTTVILTGEPMGEPWASSGWDGSNDWEFESAAQDQPEDLFDLYDGAVARARERLSALLAGGGLEQVVDKAFPDGRRMSVARLLCDMIEEYGRHTGHADLLREAIDGRVGEDPPAGWRPESGTAATFRP